MVPELRRALGRAAASAVLLAAAAAFAQEVPGAEGPRDLPARGDGLADVVSRPGKRAAHPAQRKRKLAAIDAAALRAEDAERQSAEGRAAKRWNRVGVVRDIDAVRFPSRPSRWRNAEIHDDGSRSFRAEIHAPGATGVRVRFRECVLPRGARLTVEDADEPAELYGPLRAPRDGGALWGPTVLGERVVVTLHVPATSLDERVALVADGIGHRYRPPEELYHDYAEHEHRDGPSGGTTKASLGCMNNVACDTTWFPDVSRSVARYEFESGGSFFLCTGTLLNDLDTTTTIPYFLTANHCVSTDKAARSMEIWWDYKAASCGGAAPSLASVPRTLGATLVATSGETDVTLVQITGTLPSNRYFAGWTAASQAAGTAVVGLHHPEGTHMRISYGSVTSRTNDFLTVNWTDGVTSEGSSGSAIFNDQKQVIGQLCCGLSFCSRPDDPDDYGRFEESYANVLEPYLGGTGPVGELDEWDPFDDTPLGATPLGEPPVEGAPHGPHVLVLDDAEDWFSFSLVQGSEYVFEAGAAVRGDLFSDLGTTVVASDPGLGESGFHIGVTPAASGTFRLRVRRAQEGEDTEYTLLYAKPPVQPPVAVKRLRARVTAKKAVVLTWKDLAANETGYRVELEGPDGFVELAKLGSGAKKFKHRPGPGTHVYRVGPYNAAGDTMTPISVFVRGRAGLDPSDPEDDNGAGATDLGTDSFGTTPVHELDARDIGDWFRIQLTGGTTYVFGTLGTGDTTGSVWQDAGGTVLLAFDDDVDDDTPEQPDLNFRLEFTPETTGTYFVEVKAYPSAPRATYQLFWRLAE